MEEIWGSIEAENAFDGTTCFHVIYPSFKLSGPIPLQSIVVFSPLLRVVAKARVGASVALQEAKDD